MTWPQAAHLGTHVARRRSAAEHLAHRVDRARHRLRPRRSADGNIFHPEARTLAYTDAVPLQGFAGHAFIEPAPRRLLVYNLLILGSIALSGAATYLLAHRLTGQPRGRLRRRDHLRVRPVPVRPLHAPGAAGDGLHSARACGSSIARSSTGVARHGGVRRLSRPAAPERHLLHRVPGDRSGPGHSGPMVWHALGCAGVASRFSSQPVTAVRAICALPYLIAVHSEPRQRSASVTTPRC